MQRSTRYLSLLLSSLLLCAFVLPSRQDDDDHEDETPLAEAMHSMEDALKSLRRSVRKVDAREASLASVLTCEKAILFCRTQEPAMLASIPEGERERFLTDYRLELVRTERALLDLEAALLEGQDVETLRALYKAIKGLEDPAHERFTEDG